LNVPPAKVLWLNPVGNVWAAAGPKIDSPAMNRIEVINKG
jgi:hypothetical protein